MHQEGDLTHKVDVWSLFVTMLWTRDIGEIRHKDFQSTPEVHEIVLSAASREKEVSNIREMADLRSGGATFRGSNACQVLGWGGA